MNVLKVLMHIKLRGMGVFLNEEAFEAFWNSIERNWFNNNTSAVIDGAYREGVAPVKKWHYFSLGLAIFALVFSIFRHILLY